MNASPGWHEGDDNAWWYWDGTMWTARLPYTTHSRTLTTNLSDPRTRLVTIAAIAVATVGLAFATAGIILAEPWFYSATTLTTAITVGLIYLTHCLGSPTTPHRRGTRTAAPPSVRAKHLPDYIRRGPSTT